MTETMPAADVAAEELVRIRDRRGGARAPVARGLRAEGRRLAQAARRALQEVVSGAVKRATTQPDEQT